MELLRFTAEEFAARVEGVRSGLTDHGLDALLIGTGVNLQYFSGFPSPTQTSSRPFLLLLPRRGDPALIIQAGRQHEVERFSWVQDLRIYNRLSHLPTDLLMDVIRERALEKAVIGLEWGHEMRSDLPTWEILQFADRFPGMRLVDGSDVIWRQRLIKTESEIALIRQACAITSTAYGQLFDAIHEGMTEEEVVRVFARIQNDAGGSATWAVVTSGAGNYDFASKIPTARRLAKGDMIWLDAGCNVGGYWSDFSRAAVVGGPTDIQRRYQETINCITAAGIEKIRPGLEVGEVAALCSHLLEESGLQWTTSISGSANRIGHGLGMNVTEPPSVAPYDRTIIRPGMILTIEPGVGTEHGIYHHEHNILVRPHGIEVLSTAPTELATVR